MPRVKRSRKQSLDKCWSLFSFQHPASGGNAGEEVRTFHSSPTALHLHWAPSQHRAEYGLCLRCEGKAGRKPKGWSFQQCVSLLHDIYVEPELRSSKPMKDTALACSL